MDCPDGCVPCNCHRSVSTQTCSCYSCSELNLNVCKLCELRIPAIGLSNDELLIKESVQSDTCQCFLTFTALDVLPEALISNDPNTTEFSTSTPIIPMSKPRIRQVLKPDGSGESCSFKNQEDECNKEIEKEKNSTESEKSQAESSSTDIYPLSPVLRKCFPNFMIGPDTVLAGGEQGLRNVPNVEEGEAVNLRKASMEGSKRSSASSKEKVIIQTILKNKESSSESEDEESKYTARSTKKEEPINIKKSKTREDPSNSSKSIKKISSKESKEKERRQTGLKNKESRLKSNDKENEYREPSTKEGKTINVKESKKREELNGNPESVKKISNNQNYMYSNVATSAGTSNQASQQIENNLRNFIGPVPFRIESHFRPAPPLPFTRHYCTVSPIPVRPTNFPGRFFKIGRRIVPGFQQPYVGGCFSGSQPGLIREKPEGNVNMNTLEKNQRIKEWLRSIANPSYDEHSTPPACAYVEEGKQEEINPTFPGGGSTEHDGSSSEIYDLERQRDRE